MERYMVKECLNQRLATNMGHHRDRRTRYSLTHLLYLPKTKIILPLNKLILNRLSIIMKMK